MKPAADSLDHLQGDKYCYMDDLIPTLLCTKEKLNMLINKLQTYCTHNRFEDYFTLEDIVSDYMLTSATTTHCKRTTRLQ